MIFKRFFSAFCALAICVGCAGAKKVECKSASGILDPLGYKLELNIVCNADGYYAGNFTFDEKTYFAFGYASDAEDPEISLMMFEDGCYRSELRITYEEDMDRCTGTYDMDGKSYDIEMSIRPDATMEDPFEHPTLEDFSRQSKYRFQIEEENYLYVRNLTLVKDGNGFAFNISSSVVDGYGTVKDFDKNDWTVLPYNDGKIIFKDTCDDTFVIEFFKGFAVASCPDIEEEEYEGDAALVSGAYMLLQGQRAAD